MYRRSKRTGSNGPVSGAPQPHPPVSEAPQITDDLQNMVNKYALITDGYTRTLRFVHETYRPTDPEGKIVEFGLHKHTGLVRHLFMLKPDGGMRHAVVDERKGSYSETWTEPGEFDEKGRPILHKTKAPTMYTHRDTAGMIIPQGAIVKEFVDAPVDSTTQRDMARLQPMLTSDEGRDLLKSAGLYQEFAFVGAMTLIEMEQQATQEPQTPTDTTARFTGSVALR